MPRYKHPKIRKLKNGLRVVSHTVAQVHPIKITKQTIRTAGRAVAMAQQGSRKVMENFDFDEPTGANRQVNIGAGLDTGVSRMPNFSIDSGVPRVIGKRGPKRDITDIA